MEHLPPFSLDAMSVNRAILSWNRISKIEAATFTGLVKHTPFTLDLSHNLLEYLTVVMFSELVASTSSFKIDLNDNQIRLQPLTFNQHHVFTSSRDLGVC